MAEVQQVLLPAIAWRIHSTTSSGLIGEHALHELLVETLQQHDAHLREEEAHRRAAQFRRNVSEFSGIFLERGLDEEGRGLYGFLHLTFEEYFAAMRLADKWEREGKSALVPLLHAPRWTEVILLTAGHLGESSQYRATEFVKAILSARSEYENILHRDLLLAARCLADDVRIDAIVRRGIVEKLLKLVFAKRSPSALQEDLQQVFARLGGVSAGKDIVQALVRCLADAEWNVRQATVETFGQLGPTVLTPDVLQALVRCLADAEQNVRQAAVRTLRKLSSFIRLKEWPEAPALFVPFARSRNEEKREVGYVCLRNLLAEEQEVAVET